MKLWLSGLPYWRAALDCYIHALATCAGAQHAVVTCAGAQHAVAILLEHDDSDMAGIPHGINWTTMSFHNSATVITFTNTNHCTELM